MGGRRRYQKLICLFLLALVTGFAVLEFSIYQRGSSSPAAQPGVLEFIGESPDVDRDRKASQVELNLFPGGKTEQTRDERKGEQDTINPWHEAQAEDNPQKPKRFEYREIFSLSQRDRKYFPIFFGGDAAYNPNILPHPTKHDMWIVVAQHQQYGEQVDVSEQLMCTAGFLNGVLVCSETPSVVPISPSVAGQCQGDLAYFNFRQGPRDARMFYGPDAPYIIYGSQSGYACLGLWLHDARMLLDAFRLERYMLVKYFKQATEIRRPAPWKEIEKNYFLFWDSTGKAYAHYDLWPNRVFAQIDADGSVASKNLAVYTAESDAICMAKFMPVVGPSQESIHQATNTLLVTLCSRTDPRCKVSDNNTFIMHIYHHKTYYDFHGVYEPHVILFKRNAPFSIHAISLRPFWIHGRSALTKFTGSVQYKDRDDWIPEGHTEMFYVTSMSWKSHGQRYHGYADDTILLAFGIEDTRAGAIDVTVGDLLQDLAFC